MKHFSKLLSLVLALVLTFTCVSVGIGETQAAVTSSASFRTYVNETVFALRDATIYESGSSSSTVLGTLEKGDSITRVSYSTYGWSQVIYNGKIAYIPSRHLSFMKSVNETIYTLYNTNVYAGGGSSYEKLGTLPKGSSITRTGMGSYGWSKVIYNGKTGYVANNFVATSASHRHSFKETVIAPTCSAKGYTNYICDCGAIYRSTKTAATGHNYILKWTVKPSTSTQGYDHYGCTKCGDWYQTNFTDYTCTHSSVQITTKRATCTSDGYEKRTCTNCGEVTTTVLDATGHDYEKTTVAPTTSAQGYDLYTCANCGDSYETNYTDKLHSHSYSSKVTAPTCTAKGYTTYTCSCGHSYTGNETAATGHSYTVKTVAPTTSAQGYDLHTCSKCGYSYKDNYTNKVHSHSYSSKVTAPTCTAKGYTTYTCSCGHSYTGNETAATGHSYTTKTVAPTTSAQGYDLHTCSKCGYSYKDNYTDKVSSSNNGGVDTTAIYNTLIGFKAKYPEGMAFDNSVGYSWSCPYNGSVIFYNDSGCAAFASELSIAAFGTKSFVKMYNITIADVRVGDILRINNNTHSVIVLEVHSDYVVIAEANYGGTVHWGRTLTASQVASASYLISRYPDRLG